nr:MAG TPA: hypothetical protein [Caudoviricetes sp.]
MRVKMNYNNLVEEIDRTVSASRSRAARENAFGIGIGLTMLNGYLTAGRRAERRQTDWPMR